MYSQDQLSMEMDGNLSSEVLLLPESDINLENNSSSRNDTGPAYSYRRHSDTMTGIFCVAYSIVFVLGMFGNSFVVAVVCRSPRMRTITNYFIVNLACADILVLLVCLPPTLIGNIITPWVFGWLMCKAVAYIQGVSVAAAVYSLVAVSLERYLAICHPFLRQITRARAKLVIVFIWLAAIIIPIPWALYFQLSKWGPVDIVICEAVWPENRSGSLHFLVGNLLLCYLVPLSVIAFCYVMIWMRVWHRSIPGETKGDHMNTMVQRSKVKAVKMLVVVVIIFALSWLPLYIAFTRMKLGGPPGIVEQQALEIIIPIAQWMGSSNSCINPILYAFFNKKYRKGFVAILKSKACCGKLGRRPGGDFPAESFRSTSNRNGTMKSFQYLRRETQLEFMSTSVF